MGMICCVSLSNEYINFISPAGREGKQVGQEHLVRKTNELAPLHPFLSPRISSFITRSGSLTALDGLSQVLFVLCWCSKLSILLTRPKETVINWKAVLRLPVWFSRAICLSASIWGPGFLAVFSQAKAHSSSWPYVSICLISLRDSKVMSWPLDYLAGLHSCVSIQTQQIMSGSEQEIEH